MQFNFAILKKFRFKYNLRLIEIHKFLNQFIVYIL